MFSVKKYLGLCKPTEPGQTTIRPLHDNSHPALHPKTRRTASEVWQHSVTSTVSAYQTEKPCACSVGKDLSPKSPGKLRIGKRVARLRPGQRNNSCSSDCTNWRFGSWRNPALTSIIELFAHPRTVHWHCILKDDINHTKPLSTLFSQISRVKPGK
jgi:hypothetical protein